MGSRFVFGTVERATDSRLRVTLNREFERLFADDEPIACYWADYSIALMPKQVFELFVQRLMAMPSDMKTQAFRNFFLANTTQITLDTNHRVTLRRQDLEYLRKGNGDSPAAQEDPTGESEWKEDLVLSGLYDYVIIKTKKNAEKQLTPDQMVEYGRFLEETCCQLHADETTQTAVPGGTV